MIGPTTISTSTDILFFQTTILRSFVYVVRLVVETALLTGEWIARRTVEIGVVREQPGVRPRWSWCEAKSHVDRDHPSTMIRFPLLRVAEALVVDDIRRHELVGSEPRSLKARSAGDRFGMTHQTDPQPLALPGEVDSDIEDPDRGALSSAGPRVGET